jgi:predicted aspartyl protease
MRIFGFFTVMVFLISFQTQADNFPIRLNLSKSNGNTLYASALLADKVVASFMIDTGSSVVVINQKTFDKIKAVGGTIVKTSQMGARLANGQVRLIQRYRIETLSLSKDCAFKNVEVAVMKNGNNILGMSVLTTAAPFAIFSQPDQLGLSQCGNSQLHIAAVDYGN